MYLRASHFFFAFHDMINQIYRIRLYINNLLNTLLYFIENIAKTWMGRFYERVSSFITPTAQGTRDRSMKYHLGTHSFVCTFPFLIPSKLPQRFTSPRTWIFKLQSSSLSKFTNVTGSHSHFHHYFYVSMNPLESLIPFY